MLANFEQLLIDNHLHVESRICDLESSCSSSQKMAIDFDKVKDEFYNRFRRGEMRMPKSADALILKPEQSQLIFIEMKDLTSLFEEINVLQLSREQINDRFILLFAKEFQADRKLIDSYALILEIATEFQINTAFYPHLLKAIEKRFYFVLNVTSRDFVRTNLSFLASRNRYDYLIFNKIDFIRAELLNQILDE
jgi:hypothetical protein